MIEQLLLFSIIHQQSFFRNYVMLETYFSIIQYQFYILTLLVIKYKQTGSRRVNFPYKIPQKNSNLKWVSSTFILWGTKMTFFINDLCVVLLNKSEIECYISALKLTFQNSAWDALRFIDTHQTSTPFSVTNW